MDDKTREKLKKRLTVLLVIWAAFVLTLLVYAGVFYAAGDQIKSAAKPDVPVDILRIALLAVGVVEVVVAHFIRKFMLFGAPEGLKSAFGEPAASAASIGSALSRYFVAVIISLALAEAVAIYGIVVFILGADFNTLLAFLAISALALFLFRPKMDELERIAEQIRPRL